MTIHPIQNFKAMSPAKKAAVIGGAVVGTAATAFGVASFVKGKEIAPDAKVTGKMLEGAKALIASAKKALIALKDKIANSEFVKTVTGKTKEAFETTKNAAKAGKDKAVEKFNAAKDVVVDKVDEVKHRLYKPNFTIVEEAVEKQA